MNVVTGVVLFAMIWWTVLFAVLPLGVRANPDGQAAGGWRGTPERPNIAFKAAITTAVTALLWLACYGLIESGWISFRSAWLALPD